MAATLEYLIKVQDQELKELRSKLRATGQEAETSHGHLGAFGSALGGVAKTAAIAGGAAALGGLAITLKQGWQEYQQSAKVAAQTNAVIKSTGGAAGVSSKQVSALANSLLMKTGIDDEAIQSGENLLLTFTNIRNEAGKGNDIFTQSTKIMEDMSVSLGEDGKSAAIQLGKALNDPIKGVTALQRVGVSFTQSQRDQIKALVDSGHTMEAQKLILGELNKEFGGSAEAAGKTLPGQISILKESFNNLAGNIVAGLMPTLMQVLQWITGHWPEIQAVMKAVFDAIGFVITNVVVPLFKYILIPAISYVVTWIQQNWPKIHQIVEQVMTATKEVITTVVGVILALWHRFGSTIITVVRTYFGMVFSVIKSLVEVIRGVFNLIDGLVHGRWSQIWQGLKEIFQGVFNALIAWFRGLVHIFFSIASSIGKAIIDGIVAALKGIGSALEHAILDPIKSVLGKAGGLLSHIPGASKVGSVIAHLNPFGAEGGIVNTMGSYVLGEAGPEAVIPLNRFGNNSPLPVGGLSHGSQPQNIHIHLNLDGREVSEVVYQNFLTRGLRNSLALPT